MKQNVLYHWYMLWRRGICGHAIQIKALQALHKIPPLFLFLLLHTFWHKNINVTTRFDQIHQLFHKILSINIILNSIKVITCWKVWENNVYESQDGSYISMHKQNVIEIYSLFLKTEILTSIKGHNSVEKFRKISCASHNTTLTLIKIHQYVLKILNGN